MLDPTELETFTTKPRSFTLQSLDGSLTYEQSVGVIVVSTTTKPNDSWGFKLKGLEISPALIVQPRHPRVETHDIKQTVIIDMIVNDENLFNCTLTTPLYYRYIACSITVIMLKNIKE